jgi:hypothetical protein
MFCVLYMFKCVLPPGVNPIAVDKYIISYHIKNVSLSSYFVSGYRIEIWSLSKALFNLYAGSSYVSG